MAREPQDGPQGRVGLSWASWSLPQNTPHPLRKPADLPPPEAWPLLTQATVLASRGSGRMGGPWADPSAHRPGFCSAWTLPAVLSHKQRLRTITSASPARWLKGGRARAGHQSGQV